MNRTNITNRPCPSCHGAGWVKQWFGHGYTLCAHCGGTGRINLPPPPRPEPRWAYRAVFLLALLLALPAVTGCRGNTRESIDSWIRSDYAAKQYWKDYGPLLEELAIWRTPVAEADTGYRDHVLRQPAGIHPTAHHHPREPIRASLMDISLRPWGSTGNGAEDAALFRAWLGLPPGVLTTVPQAWGAEWEWAAKAWLHCHCLSGTYGGPGGRDCVATREETTLFTYMSTSKPCPHLNPWDCQPATVTCSGPSTGTDQGCMTGWRRCPPPREADRYSPQPAPCWREISGGRITAADDPLCHVGQPPPAPQPPAPPAPEPEPPAPEPGEPGERAICESVLDVAVALGCGSLNPLPPCDGCWQCRCLEPAVCQSGVTP